MIDQPSPVYVFDLDGVMTDPENSQVNKEVVTAMYHLLENGTYLVVNTGRSYEWVEQNLVGRLEAYRNDEIFSRFMTVCEKGGEMVTWHNGRSSVRPSEFALAKGIYKITHSTFEQNKSQLQTMFWDDAKRTMATIEKLPSADLKTFRAEQNVLISKLRKNLEGHDVRLDATTIATDVELPTAGKYSGAKLIYAWVKAVTGRIDHAFISIGDSSSDYEMARYFAEQQADSTFVYVGKTTDRIAHDDRVTFIATGNHYSAGALEFLRQIR